MRGQQRVILLLFIIIENAYTRSTKLWLGERVKLSLTETLRVVRQSVVNTKKNLVFSLFPLFFIVDTWYRVKKIIKIEVKIRGEGS